MPHSEEWATVDQALARCEEGIQAIISGAAQESYESAGQRDESLVSSGFVLGWNDARKMSPPSTAAEWAAATIAKLDEAIAAEDWTGVQNTRNELASALSDIRTVFRAEVQKQLTRVYGADIAQLLAGWQDTPPPLSAEDACLIGVACLAVSPKMAAGFLATVDDTDMPCRCPAHCMQAAIERGIDARGVLASRGFIGSMERVGQWYAMHTRQAILDELKVFSATHTIDIGAAKDETHGFLSRLVLHKDKDPS